MDNFTVPRVDYKITLPVFKPAERFFEKIKFQIQALEETLKDGEVVRVEINSGLQSHQVTEIRFVEPDLFVFEILSADSLSSCVLVHLQAVNLRVSKVLKAEDKKREPIGFVVVAEEAQPDAGTDRA